MTAVGVSTSLANTTLSRHLRPLRSSRTPTPHPQRITDQSHPHALTRSTDPLQHSGIKPTTGFVFPTPQIFQFQPQIHTDRPSYEIHNSHTPSHTSTVFTVSCKKPTEAKVTPTPSDPGRQAREARVLSPPSSKPSPVGNGSGKIPRQAQSSRKPYHDQWETGTEVTSSDRRSLKTGEIARTRRGRQRSSGPFYEGAVTPTQRLHLSRRKKGSHNPRRQARSSRKPYSAERNGRQAKGANRPGPRKISFSTGKIPAGERGRGEAGGEGESGFGGTPPNEFLWCVSGGFPSGPA